MTLPHSVICIERMDIPSRGMFLVAVALSSNHVLIYNDKNVVDCFKTDDAVSAMKFGRFGREDGIGLFRSIDSVNVGTRSRVDGRFI